MSVGLRSTKLTNNFAPQISLQQRISKPLRCTRMRRWTGVDGAGEEQAGDRWECGSEYGGYRRTQLINFLSHNLIQRPLCNLKHTHQFDKQETMKPKPK